MERLMGELFEDYKIRRKRESIAEKIWNKGRFFHISSGFIKKEDGKTYHRSSTYCKSGILNMKDEVING